MRRKKVKQFSDPGSKTSSIPLKNSEEVKGGEKAGGVKGQPAARGGGDGAEGEDTKWVGRERSISRGRARLYSGGIQVGGIRGGSHRVTSKDAAGGWQLQE